MDKIVIDKVSASFRSKKTELSYRMNFMSIDRRQIVIALLLLCLPVLVFIPSDYFLFGYSSNFIHMILARSFAIIFLSATIFTVIKSENIFNTDKLVLASLMINCCLVLYINLSRPSDYLQHSMLDILIVFTAYILIPNRFFFQIIPAITLTLFNLYVFLFHKEAATIVTSIVFWFSFIFANIIGMWTAWHLHIYRRRQFRTQLEERAATEKLQIAMGEINTLQGILPICAKCKKIRDDKGSWNQLESYIECHSDAHFSHGLCLECEDALYGDEEWYRKLKVD